MDLGDLKAQIVKRLGPEKSKQYFYYLNRLFSQKLSKKEFDKLCCRVLGRENLSLHNQFIRSILKNAYQAKTPPPVYEAGAAKSTVQVAKSSPTREDGQEQSGTAVAIHNQNLPIWPNGVIPVSPKKGRSGIRDRKLKDRPSSLGPNGKVECASQQPTGREDGCSKGIAENGVVSPCDYQRPVQHLQVVSEHLENGRKGSVWRPAEKPRLAGKDMIEATVVGNVDKVEHLDNSNFSSGPLLAPLGIPYCSSSIGGAHKAISVGGTGDFLSCCESGGLPDTETLRKRMEQIAVAQGLGGVSVECASMLNHTLDVYLKRLIGSCVDLVGARSAPDPRKQPSHNLQTPDKFVNGMWPGNHLRMQSGSGSIDSVQGQRQPPSVSMLDFRVAMELNPQQLGDDWPLLLEKICQQAFEE